MEYWKGGDCLSCQRVPSCTETDAVKLSTSYRCPSFLPVEKEVYEARLDALNLYGPRVALQALSTREPEEEEEENNG